MPQARRIRRRARTDASVDRTRATIGHHLAHLPPRSFSRSDPSLRRVVRLNSQTSFLHTSHRRGLDLEAIANAHYRQVTDDHFASAVKPSNTSKHPDKRVSANPTRNPTQYIAETGCNDTKTPFHPNENRPVFPGDSSHSLSLQSTSMGHEGFEPPTLSV